MLSDRRHPCFRNFDSVVSIDVIRMKSYLDSLFDPTCVSVRVTIDKLDQPRSQGSLLSVPTERERERDPGWVWSRGPRTKLIPREESFVSQFLCLVRFHRHAMIERARQIC